MKILISIFFIVLLSGCASETEKAANKTKLSEMNPTLYGSIKPKDDGWGSEKFIIRIANVSKKDFWLSTEASQKKADSVCRQAGFEEGAQWSNDNGVLKATEDALKGNHTYFCTGESEIQNQIVLIDKAKELCTNIGYTPNTDSHRGCVVELMKVDSGGTNVTVNSTNYQDMIDRGICMTTGKCDITGQPIIKQSQNTITNARCRVTGTGAWKTIQCF